MRRKVWFGVACCVVVAALALTACAPMTSPDGGATFGMEGTAVTSPTPSASPVDAQVVTLVAAIGAGSDASAAEVEAAQLRATADEAWRMVTAEAQRRLDEQAAEEEEFWFNVTKTAVAAAQSACETATAVYRVGQTATADAQVTETADAKSCQTATAVGGATATTAAAAQQTHAAAPTATAFARMIRREERQDRQAATMETIFWILVVLAVVIGGYAGWRAFKAWELKKRQVHRDENGALPALVHQPDLAEYIASLLWAMAQGLELPEPGKVIVNNMERVPTGVWTISPSGAEAQPMSSPDDQAEVTRRAQIIELALALAASNGGGGLPGQPSLLPSSPTARPVVRVLPADESARLLRVVRQELVAPDDEEQNG